MKLDNYETVKSRKLRFYTDHPDGRIVVNIVQPDEIMEFALICAKIFLNREDQKDGLPRGVGFALEIRDKELSRSSNGKEYESVNYSSWTENCEESAVGRALDNAGYASNGTCSAEEIIKAKQNTKVLTKTQSPSVPMDPNDPVIPFGKLKGKKVSEVKSDEALSYANWLESESQKTGKSLSDNAKTVIAAIRKTHDIPF